MKPTLIQRLGNKTKEFSIDDTGLLLFVKSKESEKELYYPFEVICTSKATILDHNKTTLVIAYIFAIITIIVFIAGFFDPTVEIIAAPIWALISIVLFIYYYKTKKKKTYLQTTDNRTIEFVIEDGPHDTVDNFIHELINERNTYLISKYGNINRHLEYNPQLENLNWLLNARVISKAQYDEKIQELNALFNGNSGTKSIGFGIRN